MNHALKSPHRVVALPYRNIIRFPDRRRQLLV